MNDRDQAILDMVHRGMQQMFRKKQMWNVRDAIAASTTVIQGVRKEILALDAGKEVLPSLREVLARKRDELTAEQEKERLAAAAKHAAGTTTQEEEANSPAPTKEKAPRKPKGAGTPPPPKAPDPSSSETP